MFSTQMGVRMCVWYLFIFFLILDTLETYQHISKNYKIFTY